MDFWLFAIVDFMENIVPPLLASPTEADFRTFARAYTNYVMLGGNRSLLSLIFPDVLELLICRSPDLRKEGIVVKDLSSEALLAALWSLFAPRNREEAWFRFKELQMKGTGLEAFTRFALDFQALRKECKEFAPVESKLIGFFIQALRPTRFSDTVEAADPKRLEEAISIAFDVIERGHSTTPVDRSPIICHQCGEPGHIKPKCPKLKESGSSSESSTPAEAAKKRHASAKVTGRNFSINTFAKVARVTAELKDRAVSVLWDTGSDVNIISKELADSLVEQGEPFRMVRESLETAAGLLPVSRVMDLSLKLRSQDGMARSVPLHCKVADICEDVVLGFKSTHDFDLVPVLARMLEDEYG